MKQNRLARANANPLCYEDFRVLVPCLLVEADKHDIVIRLHSDNRVQFQNGCELQARQAAARLGVRTCDASIESLKANVAAITYSRQEDVQLCMSCRSAVVILIDSNYCPFNARHRLQNAPFWTRILRVGRVSQPRKKPLVVG